MMHPAHTFLRTPGVTAGIPGESHGEVTGKHYTHKVCASAPEGHDSFLSAILTLEQDASQKGAQSVDIPDTDSLQPSALECFSNYTRKTYK